MRFMVYLVAILIAAGIVYIMGKPSETVSGDSSFASSTTRPTDPISVADGDVQRMALSVPGMHCAFGCYPTVKETLETVDGVQGVELAKQKNESELDDKTVFVTHTNAFKLEIALAQLEKAGFEATQIQGK